MTSPGELALCLSTLLADPMSAGADEVVSALDAAAAAGCGGVSAWTLHVLAFDPDPAAFREAAASRGLSVDVVEAAVGWSSGAGDAGPDADLTLEVAEGVGAQQVVAVCLDPVLADAAAAVRGFADLCDRAAARGIRVALEFLPWTGVPGLADAWALVEAAGRSNGGILLDAWHWQRQPGGPCPDLLATLPPSAVHLLQLCDARPEPGDDAMAEAMAERLVPGDGVVDFEGLAAALLGSGATPLLSPEVFSRDGLSLGPEAFAAGVVAACCASWPAP